MKKILSMTALVLALAVCFCACSGQKEVVKHYNSAADFAEFGISLDAPDGSSDMKYDIVESASEEQTLNIAQVSYTYNDVPCVLRCANIGSHNVSGYDENKAQSEEEYDLNVEGFSSKIRVMLVDGKYVAIWTLGEHSYSLFADTKDPLAATSCAMDAANANIPSASVSATE